MEEAIERIKVLKRMIETGLLMHPDCEIQREYLEPTLVNLDKMIRNPDAFQQIAKILNDIK